jgi:hypothetical protein
MMCKEPVAAYTVMLGQGAIISVTKHIFMAIDRSSAQHVLCRSA